MWWGGGWGGGAGNARSENLVLHREETVVCLCFQVVSLLLCQGADPNARDNWNYTPLHEAAIKGKIDVCIGGAGAGSLKKPF